MSNISDVDLRPWSSRYVNYEKILNKKVEKVEEVEKVEKVERLRKVGKGWERLEKVGKGCGALG